jgi:hypothetical protein
MVSGNDATRRKPRLTLQTHLQEVPLSSEAQFERKPPVNAEHWVVYCSGILSTKFPKLGESRTSHPLIQLDCRIARALLDLTPQINSMAVGHSLLMYSHALGPVFGTDPN